MGFSRFLHNRLGISSLSHKIETNITNNIALISLMHKNGKWRRQKVDFEFWHPGFLRNSVKIKKKNGRTKKIDSFTGERSFNF